MTDFLISLRGHRLCWNIVKHVFSESAHEKMIFTGTRNHEDILSRYMDLEVLPSAISPDHGKGYAADGMPQCFEGGILPSYDYNESSSFCTDSLKKTVSTITDATSAMAGDSCFEDHVDHEDPLADANEQFQQRGVYASKVNVSASILGSGVFRLDCDGGVCVQACS